MEKQYSYLNPLTQSFQRAKLKAHIDNALLKINVLTTITGFALLCFGMILFHYQRESDSNRKLMQSIGKQNGGL